MTKIKLELDKLTSLLVSYHILCAPTELNKEYNPDIFKNLAVTPEERGLYLTNLLAKGVTLDRTDDVRFGLFLPEFHSLEDYLTSDKIPEAIKDNLRAFEKRFDQYFGTVKQRVSPLIEKRKEEAESVIDKIYGAAEEITGIKIKRPSELEIRVVEGIAPSSRGSEIKDGKMYIIEQTRNFLDNSDDSYLITLIHEAVAHQTAEQGRQYYKELFGGYVYNIEEGFAKLFTRKVAEKVLGRDINYFASEGIETISYNTFEKNWDKLNNNFNEWYKDCLTEIKYNLEK